MTDVLELPEILSQSQDGLNASFRLRIPADSPYFQGHYAGFPILPGVVQIGWAEQLGRRLFPLPPRFVALEALKFQELIRPGYEVELSLAFKPEKGKLEFAYRCASGQYSAGRLAYTEAE
ncbi:MAG: hypothetical protein HYV16_07790 [Gammaproteobacteria bacterium]|nr:hypothetical protein [Gammaproteobacteria bacterium]